IRDRNVNAVQTCAPPISDATCPGTEGTDELVPGEHGTPVTYCFTITNTGDVTLLAPVELDDPDLGITQEEMTLVSGDNTVNLEPGDQLVYSYEIGRAHV